MLINSFVQGMFISKIVFNVVVGGPSPNVNKCITVLINTVYDTSCKEITNNKDEVKNGLLSI